MELVEGETLASRLERGRLPLEHALAIAEQIDQGAHLNVFMNWTATLFDRLQ